jgi:diacylglycerol kinase family enzyme
MPDRPADRASSPRLQSIAAIVNPAAGSVAAGAEALLRALVAEYGYSLSMHTVAAGNVEQVVQAAVGGHPDLVVVLAGDGTARLAAEACGADGPLVAPLPGGTLNMLPHAIYGVQPWQDALRAALEAGQVRAVSGGRVCGRTFHVAALLGAPALWSAAREAVRAGRLIEAWRRMRIAASRAFRGGVQYGADGVEPRHGEALALICPLVSRALDTECALEMAALDFHNAREMARLALRGVTGAWRDDPSVSIQRIERGWATMRGSMPAILDGEAHKLPRRVEFEFVARAFRTLAPPDAAVAAL